METELHNFEKGSGFVQTSTGINKSDIKRDFHDLLRKWYVNDIFKIIRRERFREKILLYQI